MTPTLSPIQADFGLEVLEITADSAFSRRKIHERDVPLQMEGMRRIARAFVEDSENVLQELVNAAVDLCGADSAGISIEKDGKTDREFYSWIATAGTYSGFLDAVLPRYPSACGICLERGSPQNFRVRKEFFDVLGVEAPLVTDGILLPWQVDSVRGTIFVMAHNREEAFDMGDCQMMTMLADFAAAGFKQQTQQKQLIAQAGATAASAMANELAHKINNPLQSLTNVLYLVAQGHHGEEARPVGKAAMTDLTRLSTLVGRLLALPFNTPPPLKKLRRS
jgi:hypothetical protein